MRYVEAGGVRLSAIGLGTWQFGSNDWGYGNDYAKGEAARIVARALELGVNLIDTAEVYGRGASERIVGDAIRDVRDRVFLATKVMPITPTAGFVEKHGRKSLERLGIDAIDLYQLHFPNPTFPLREQLGGMRRLRDAGVVRNVGVSNYSLSRWQASDTALGAPVLSNQVQYSLAMRKPDRDLVPWAQANDRIVIAYSPLAKGLLSGRYDSTNLPDNPARLHDPLFLPGNVERAGPLVATLREIADAHDVRPSQVALAWVVQHPNVVAIPGASSLEQLEANCAAADLDLKDDEVTALDDVSARFTPELGAGAWAKIAKRRVKR
jgi:aryl-alcohol dehydrogenase-like predicted oxidoreductase